MKKILTAINNPRLNEELKKQNYFEVVGKDIQYKEAILEILEKNNNINLIIINEKIPGEISIEKLIKKINVINKEIKIIFILEKENIELKKILIKNNINEIYYNNKVNLAELIKIINKKEINYEEIIKIMEKENINNYLNKKINNNYSENNLIINENKEKNFLKNKYKNIKKEIFLKIKNIYTEKILNKKIESYKNCRPKIITFSGNYKSGKTTLALAVCQYLLNEKSNKKVLLIDLDLEKEELGIILKKEKKIEKIKNKINNRNKLKKIQREKPNKINTYKRNKRYKNKIKYLYFKKLVNLFIFKINKNYYFLPSINFLFKKYKNFKNYFLKIILEEIKYKYDFIIVDLGKSNSDDINKTFLKKSDKNFLVLEANILGAKEIRKLTEKYIKEWKIKKSSLYFISNKKKINSIHKNIIKNIIPNIRKILEIKENIKINLLINNYFKNRHLLNNKKIKNEFNKIIKIIKNRNTI